LIWEYKSSYEGLTEEQISAMTFDELEQSEHNRMKHNAFKVCEELTYQIDGATAPGGFMKAYTSQDSDDLFFNNHDHLKAFLSTTDIKGDKKQCPGWNYFTMLKTFFDQHVEVGEKYMEYVKCTCEHCEICATNTWIGPSCCKVPKPYPDYTSDGFHYLDVHNTPTEVDGEARAIDDFQPRKQAADQMKERKLESEEQLDTFSKKFIVEKTKLRKYTEHLTYLEIKRKKRAENRKQMSEQEQQKTFLEYNWLELFEKCLLSTLKVHVLDKYLSHYKLQGKLKLKKAEKLCIIQRHIATTHMKLGTGGEDQPLVDMDQVDTDQPCDTESETNSELDSGDSANDIVLADTYLSDSSSGSEEHETANDATEASTLFTTTRSGRITVNTTNWRAAQYRNS
jgi:hypothetical protein